MRNFFIQSMLVAVLTTQFMAILSMAVAEKESPVAVAANSNMLRSLYPRSADLKQAPLPEKEGAVDSAAGSLRGQRCVKCGGGYGNGAGYGAGGYGYGSGGGGGNYGNYYGNYADRDRGAYYGREDPYAYNRDPNAQRDRNWYYQQPSQDTRYGYDRNPYDRYDDRYYGRANPYESDPYYQNTNANGNANNYNSYRGNGYDNLNPQYYESMREQFNQRGRTYGGYNDYDRFNERPAYRGYYDNRNFRPYDETYSTAYGGRPQSLGSSYLFERSDDANLGSGLNAPAGSVGEKKQESANLEMKNQ